MKILFTGRGGAGSWTIRGEQIGRALGAKVQPQATLADCVAADVIVAVKRVPDELLRNIRKSGRPWAYDVVDAYPQPSCTTWTRKESIEWLHAHIARLQPDFVIWPNKQMQNDFGGRGSVIYHHHRPALATNPIREHVKTIGYEGAPSYIAEWMPAILSECERRGWLFLTNPSRLADLDIVLALRGSGFNGYPQSRWKSNVKLANAQGSGTPFIGAVESSYSETAAGGEILLDSTKHLREAFNALAPYEVRSRISGQFRAAAISIDDVANNYRKVLCGLR